MAFSWVADRTFMGSPLCMRVDVQKIVPPFIFRRRRRVCFRREDVCIKGKRGRVDRPKRVPPT